MDRYSPRICHLVFGSGFPVTLCSLFFTIYLMQTLERERERERESECASEREIKKMRHHNFTLNHHIQYTAAS